MNDVRWHDPMRAATCHETCRDHLRAHSCAVCGGAVEPAAGIILARLYPGATFCTGCGRRQLHCDCARSALDGTGLPAARDLRGRTERKEAA